MQTIKFRTEYTPVRENFTLNPEKPVRSEERRVGKECM